MKKSSDNDESEGAKLLINVRVEPAQKAAYEAAAKKKRKAVSVWIREVLDAEAERLGIVIE